MRNISDLKNVPKMLVGDCLESNEADFKVDAGPDREPMEILNHLCDAGVHVGFGYRIDSIQRGLSHNACKRVLYSLQLFDVSVVYTIENPDYCVGHRYGGVPIKMFANAPKLAHVVVATLGDRVDGRDKVEI